MIDPNISESEKVCIRALAKLFTEGKKNLHHPHIALNEEGLNLDETSYEVMMGMMQKYGAIKDPSHAFGEPFCLFEISANVISLARELDSLDKQKSEPRDIVQQLNENIRSHRILAWILIVFFILMAVATFVNQTISILQNLGWMTKPT